MPGKTNEPSSGVSDDDDPAGFKRRARRRSKSAKAVIKCCVTERQEKALKKSSSSGLFKAMKPTDKWLKRLRRSLLADEGGLSFFAVMCGCWWPCGGLRRSGAVRACVCGYEAGPDEVTTHFVLGADKSGKQCPAAADASKAPSRPRSADSRLCGGGSLFFFPHIAARPLRRVPWGGEGSRKTARKTRRLS